MTRVWYHGLREKKRGRGLTMLVMTFVKWKLRRTTAKSVVAQASNGPM